MTLPWQITCQLAAARLRELDLGGYADSIDRCATPAEGEEACRLALDALDPCARVAERYKLPAQVWAVEAAVRCARLAIDACRRAIEAIERPPESGPRAVDDGPDEAAEPVTTSEGG